MVSTIKFSEFANSVRTSSTNKNVGLSGGLNAQADLTVTWTTATRPTPPYNGLLGYNTDLSEYEYYDTVTASWLQIGPGGTGSVTLINTGTGLTGGPITTTGTISFAAIGANSFWANTTGGSAVPAVTPLSLFLLTANNLSDVPSKAAARANLGLQIGVNVEAWSAALDSIAALTTVANNLIYTTASNTYSVIAPMANGVLASNGSSVPGWTQTLPTAVQSNITQLGAQSQALNMNSHQINNVTDPTNPQDAATMAYVTAQTTGQFLPLIGGTMAGIINMGNHKITNMTDPSSAQDAVTVNYLNAQLLNYLQLSGGTMTGAINMGSFKITNLLDPTNPQDAATKNYVDLVATGLTVQPACYAATTGNLTATYNNAASGIGATLTNSGALAQFTTDGTTPPTNARILVWEQSSTLQNGIYTLTNQGSGAVAWILTRATDYDQPAEIQPGDLVIINNGTIYAGTSFIETASVSAIGTDPILFSQFTFSASSVLLKANNLSDVANTTTAFNNISPLTTKGDLIGYSTQNIRVAVGNTNGQILQVNSAATPGISWSTATYPITTTANQILYSSATNTVTGLSSIAGGVLVTDASSVPSFLTNPGAAGKVLQSANAAIPTWSTPTYPSASGTLGKFLISDGTNNVYSTSTIPTSAGATANKVLLSDGTNYVLSTPTFPNASATARKIIVSDGTNWVASTETYAVPGTSGNVLTSNGTNWISSAPTGSGTVNSGLINQLAYYAAAGTAVSGLSIVNSAVLTTTSGGVPTWVAYTGTNAPVLGTSPTITSPAINAIVDQTFNLPVLSFTGAASAVNVIAAVASATGNPVGFQFSGTDSNVNVAYTTKGTGTHSFYNGLGVSTQPLFTISGSATNTVNYIAATGAIATASPTLAATGTDTNIALTLHGKGSSGVVVSDKLTFPSPFVVGATSVTSTGTQLNLLNALTVVPINKVIVQTFTSSGTYTPTSGMVYCTIECLGSGAGGGGTANSGATSSVQAGGGGAGSYARKTTTAATIGASQTVTVGAAGTGGSAGNNAGNPGNDVSVGTICIGKGGTGGAGSAGTTPGLGGAGGVAGTGDFTPTGENGRMGQSSGAGNVAGIYLGWGGNTMWGSGGSPNANASAAGVAATGFGAGGGGGTSIGATGAQAGGNGSKGIVVITEYVSA